MKGPDSSPPRLNSNQRAASTIIMLCVVTMMAVVFVHKESMAGDIEETVGHKAQQEVGAWDEHDIADVSEVLLQKQRGKHRRTRVKDETGADEFVMMQVEEKAKNPELGILDKLGNHYDPVINDTLVPEHTSLKTAVTEQYGDYDPKVVANARQVAAAALAAGDDEATALKKAQAAATQEIVLDSSKHGEFPAFSRTIKAAAFAAQKKAMTVLEDSEDLAEAKSAAHSAATEIVHDPRSLDIAVPVADGLTQLLNHIDDLWTNMKSKVGELTEKLKKMPKADCPEEELAADASSHELNLAMIHAKRHIANGHSHHQAMERHRKAADAHQAHALVLLQKGTATSAKATQKLAEESKRQSAQHHEHAKKHVHLAENFLSLAMKHHDHATDVALQCKARHILHQFGYAENAMDTYDEKVKEIAKKKEEKASEAKHKLLVKETKEKDIASGAKEKRKKAADKESELDSKNAPERANKKARATRAHIQQNYTSNSNRHFNATGHIKQLVVAMQTSLPKEMSIAVNKAVRTDNGKEPIVDVANQAATVSIKVAAKKLASDMIKLVKKGQETSALMKKAIIMVLKVGRPIQAKIVTAAIKKAAKHNPTQSNKATEKKALKDLKSTVAVEKKDSSDKLLKEAVAKATTKAATAAQQQVAAAGGSLADQLKAAQIAAAEASKMAAASFKAQQSEKQVALGLLQQTATSALKQYLAEKKQNGGKSDVVRMQDTVKAALQPLLSQGIARATTAAASDAGKKALIKGLTGAKASDFVSNAAKQAAVEAKAQGIDLAAKAVAKSIAEFA